MKKDKKWEPIHVLILVLVILLLISGTALVGTLLYKYFRGGESTLATAPDNVISPEKSEERVSVTEEQEVSQVSPEEKETVLKIYHHHGEDSTPFHVVNMFPGDAEKKSYYLEVSYQGSVTLHFHADIRDGYEKLAEVLKCSISLRDRGLLYDGLMREMPESISYMLPESNGTTEQLVYDITVYLDTSVGNEYMTKELYADFRWWVAEGEDSNGSDKTGTLIRPKTGDDVPLYLWCGLAGGSLLLGMLLLFRKKRRKERTQQEDRHET